MHLGEWFAKQREVEGRSPRKDFAEAADVSLNTVNGWAQGWVMPRPDRVRFIEQYTKGEVTSADLHKGYKGPRSAKQGALAA